METYPTPSSPDTFGIPEKKHIELCVSIIIIVQANPATLHNEHVGRERVVAYIRWTGQQSPS